MSQKSPSEIIDLTGDESCGPAKAPPSRTAAVTPPPRRLLSESSHHTAATGSSKQSGSSAKLTSGGREGEEEGDDDIELQFEPPPRRIYHIRTELNDNRHDETAVDATVNIPNSMYQTLGQTRYLRQYTKEHFQFKYFSERDGFPQAIGYRPSLGRVYYPAFTFGSLDYQVGMFVELSDNGVQAISSNCKQLMVHKILSVFQATKSWQGVWSVEGRKDELQKRGAYIHPHL